MRKDIWWFQPRAIQQIHKSWRNMRAVCLVSPPGSGKTVMAEGAVQGIQGVDPDDVVCLTHTLGLVRNSVRRLTKRTYTVQQCLTRGGIPGPKPKVVVWDECHHSAGEVWGTVLDLVPKNAKILGLTGTPQRADGKALDRFEAMVIGAHYSELLMAGTIVPWTCLYPDEFREDADPDPASAYKRYGGGKKALFYCKNIEQAKEVTTKLGKVAAEWHSQMPWRGENGRDKVLERYERGEVRCLVTVDALSEGVDLPDSECVVLAAKCHHVGTYLQKTGRGGRSSPGKTDALLLDLVGAHTRHGPPTEDREYTINGSGIRRHGGGGNGNDWYYEREPREADEVGSYDAKLVVGYSWRSPSEEERRKNLGWLIDCAGRRGWSKDVAEAMFDAVFGPDGEAV